MGDQDERIAELEAELRAARWEYFNSWRHVRDGLMKIVDRVDQKLSQSYPVPDD